MDITTMERLGVSHLDFECLKASIPARTGIASYRTYQGELRFREAVKLCTKDLCLAKWNDLSSDIRHVYEQKLNELTGANTAVQVLGLHVNLTTLHKKAAVAGIELPEVATPNVSALMVRDAKRVSGKASTEFTLRRYRDETLQSLYAPEEELQELLTLVEDREEMARVEIRYSSSWKNSIWELTQVGWRWTTSGGYVSTSPEGFATMHGLTPYTRKATIPLSAAFALVGWNSPVVRLSTPAVSKVSFTPLGEIGKTLQSLGFRTATSRRTPYRERLEELDFMFSTHSNSNPRKEPSLRQAALCLVS